MIIKIKNKVVGEISGNIFSKHVRESKHLMKIMDAWGIDAAVFHAHIEPQDAQVLIMDDDTGKHYKATVQDFKEHGVERDFGYGRQIFLSRKYFK